MSILQSFLTNNNYTGDGGATEREYVALRRRILQIAITPNVQTEPENK